MHLADHVRDTAAGFTRLGRSTTSFLSRPRRASPATRSAGAGAGTRANRTGPFEAKHSVRRAKATMSNLRHGHTQANAAGAVCCCIRYLCEAHMKRGCLSGSDALMGLRPTDNAIGYCFKRRAGIHYSLSCRHGPPTNWSLRRMTDLRPRERGRRAFWRQHTMSVIPWTEGKW